MNTHYNPAYLIWPGLVFGGIIAFLWAFHSVLAPFVAGLGIAYLLNPVVTRLDEAGLSRALSAGLIVLLFFAILSGLVMLVIPVAYQELKDLLQQAPALLKSAQGVIAGVMGDVVPGVEIPGWGDFLQTLQSNSGEAVQAGQTLLSSAVDGGQAVAGMLSFLVFVPITAFFMMAEWPKVLQWADSLIPRRHYDTIKDLCVQMNGKIAAFARGQFLVMLALGLFYAIALTVAGLKFGFVIGLVSGLLAIIPYLGSVFGLLTSAATAGFQSEWDLGFVGLVIGIFLLGQFLEGNVVSPKLLGDSVGLHPLWILFAVAAGGSVLGLTGMVLGVPVVAAASVLAGFVIGRYKHSAFYQGPSEA